MAIPAKQSRLLGWRAAVAAGWLAMVVLALAGWSWLQVLRPGEVAFPVTPAQLGWEYEEVGLTTEDGLTLSAWLIRGEKPENRGKRAVILLHGYPGTKTSMVFAAEPLRQEYDLLLIDFRYFGDSEGSFTTLGVKEGKDLAAGVKWLREKGYEKVAVLGFSMGGAVALGGAGTGLPIEAVASWGSFASLEDLARSYYRPLGPAAALFLGLTKAAAKVWWGEDLAAAAPVKQAARVQIPVLLIHSKQDEVVGFGPALELEAALEHNGQLETYFYDKGGHGEVPDEIKQEFDRMLVEWFGRWLE